MASFPMATKTFNVQRKTVVMNALGNPVPGGLATVISNLSVYLRDLNSQLVNGADSATTEIGLYRGACATGTNLMVNDVLFDLTENDAFGNPVQYLVLQVTKLLIYEKLHLKRITAGV